MNIFDRGYFVVLFSSVVPIPNLSNTPLVFARVKSGASILPFLWIPGNSSELWVSLGENQAIMPLTGRAPGAFAMAWDSAARRLTLYQGGERGWTQEVSQGFIPGDFSASSVLLSCSQSLPPEYDIRQLVLQEGYFSAPELTFPIFKFRVFGWDSSAPIGWDSTTVMGAS